VKGELPVRRGTNTTQKKKKREKGAKKKKKKGKKEKIVERCTGPWTHKTKLRVSSSAAEGGARYACTIQITVIKFTSGVF